MDDSVSFFLNGKPVTIENPSPQLLLIDYLKSPKVALSGPKKPCGQGGCGGCTVILSEWDFENKKPNHRAINSCLRPVCTLDGLTVTTVEGTGAARKPEQLHVLNKPSSTRSQVPNVGYGSKVTEDAKKESQEKRLAVLKDVEAYNKSTHKLKFTHREEDVSDFPSEQFNLGINPVSHRLAINNGSQCGYCSVGFVMNMSEFIANNPKATKEEIEKSFDGNLCRCTGYRSILTGMKTFASDWTEQDEENRMKCLYDEVSESQLPTDVVIPFPKHARKYSSGFSGHFWHTPRSLKELANLIDEYPSIRFIHGNTSYGVYKLEYIEAGSYADIRFLPELNTPFSFANNKLRISASTTYSEFIEFLENTIKDLELKNTEYGPTILKALEHMAHRTAGRIVRNVASIGGNTMLVLKHIEEGEPFPSDLFTTLFALDTKVIYFELKNQKQYVKRESTALKLVNDVREDPTLAHRILLSEYIIPIGGPNEIALAQKVALREVNSHSIVNSTTLFSIDKKGHLESVNLVFGGIQTFPWRAAKTEKQMLGENMNLENLSNWIMTLKTEVEDELKSVRKRMAEVPDEGFTEAYRTDLATTFLYKSVVNALLVRGDDLPGPIESAGIIKWGTWGTSEGTQKYSMNGQEYKAPVGQPYIKVTAMYQTSGQTHYTHELPVPPRTLNGAFVQATEALVNYDYVHPTKKQYISVEDLKRVLTNKFPTFSDLITDENFKKGGINLQGMGLDQPLFAVDLISYVGQSIAMVLADDEQDANTIAAFIANECITYSPPEGDWEGKWGKPILSLIDAIKKGSIFPDAPTKVPFVSHIWRITRPGSRFDWSNSKGNDPSVPKVLKHDKPIPAPFKVLVDSVPCTLISSSQLCGGQAHFYMEPQACIATPINESRLKVQPSVQSPAAMHDTVAMALGVLHNQVEVKIPPVGGGFGGKTEQTRFVAGPTAVAAIATKRPVRLAVSRDEDTALIGKRHAYYGEYEIAVDDGANNEADKGIIRGLVLNLWGDGGAFYDCSFIVSNCIQLRTDNAYMIKNFQSQIDVCRTNTAPNTAMRAFGDVQGKNVLENAIDDAATALNMRPEELREKNLYQRGDVTPFGQALSYCYMKQVWDYTKDVSNYDQKLADVQKFNRENKWRKRGLAVVPVKYGSGYNLLAIEQAAAIVVVNPSDGSVIIHQGGVEIGQGLVTQSQQVAAYVLGIPMDMIFIDDVNTNVTPKPTSTGGSTGTPYSAEAVKQTCDRMRTRMLEFGYRMRDENGDAWCKDKGIDFWNYSGKNGIGWDQMVTVNSENEPVMIWQNLTSLANSSRVEMIATFNAKINGGEVQIPSMTFKPESEQPNIPGIDRLKGATLGGGVDSFVGFTYSAACSVAEIDVLTGEMKIISSDIVYDMGWSMNPAIDIGQVEGAFVQGIGYLTTEKLVTQPDGPNKGRLNTTNTWRYKIPAITTIPLEMNTHLFPRDLPSVENIPEDSNQIFSAKEVGEPPLVLANSVFFAIKDAIRESRKERKLSPLFKFDAPATVQEVRKACDVKESHLTEKY